MKYGFPGPMSIGLIVCAFASTDLMAGTCRVKVGGCGCSTTCTGANWTSQCFEFLQDALAESTCTEIWVTAGTSASPHEGGALWLQGRDGTSGCPTDPVPTITDSTSAGRSPNTSRAN